MDGVTGRDSTILSKLNPTLARFAGVPLPTPLTPTETPFPMAEPMLESHVDHTSRANFHRHSSLPPYFRSLKFKETKKIKNLAGEEL